MTAFLPDLRYAPKVTPRRYAAVGDSGWPKLMYYLWLLIRPVWPMAPEAMRYFTWAQREQAMAWLCDTPR